MLRMWFVLVNLFACLIVILNKSVIKNFAVCVPGHFTQLVWRSTRYFGVGKARSRSGKIVIVAHYSPAGNISGAFEYNVLPPSCIEYPAPPPKFMVSSESGTSGSSCNTSTTWVRLNYELILQILTIFEVYNGRFLVIWLYEVF